MIVSLSLYAALCRYRCVRYALFLYSVYVGRVEYGLGFFVEGFEELFG